MRLRPIASYSYVNNMVLGAWCLVDHTIQLDQPRKSGSAPGDGSKLGTRVHLGTGTLALEAGGVGVGDFDISTQCARADAAILA